MAIHITINDAKVADDHLVLAIASTNDDFPGQTEVVGGSYDLTMSPVEIKAAIDAAMTLLWTALSVRQWTI